MSSVPNNSGVYVIIRNIHKTVRSNQLRNFFSSFVESCGFICFHYIHRPEVQKPLDSPDSDERSRCVSNCCIVKVVAVRVHELIENYNGQNWLDGNGETLPTCCLIKEIKLTENCNSIQGSCRWTYRKKLPAGREEFSIQEIESFHELYPPFFMPNGNVGTTTDYFLNEIRTGRLPLRVVRKLGLPLPRGEARGIYSSVAFDSKSKKDRQILKKKLKRYNLNTKPFLRPSFYNGYWHSQLPGEFSYWEDMDYKEILYPGEVEWDQYETLQDDVSGQERLFEEKMGLEWKKGSGLVFYPDSQYSIAQEGFFNAKTSDDWGIDPRIYQEPGVKFPRSQANGCSYWEEENYKQILYPEEEAWHRYKALQGNVYGQEKIFEENIGSKLDKRGSGMVFYPNYQYWNTKEGYFYGKTLDDGNIDTRIYKEPSVNNDKDISDLKKTKLEEGSQNETEVDKGFEFAGFEKYNKGIGSKILEALGWKKGQGIGKNGDGIAEPLPNEGQFPTNKKGFGYQVVKLEHPPKEKSQTQCSNDPKDSFSSSCAKLKHQKEFLKETT